MVQHGPNPELLEMDLKGLAMEAIGNAIYLDGYGIYVWPAFATAAAVLFWMAISTLYRLRHNERSLNVLKQSRGRTFSHPGSTMSENEGGKP